MSAMIERIFKWCGRHPIAAVAVFMFVVFSLGSAGVEITRINIRFALMSEELAKGNWGLFPTINGQPYADYPIACNVLSYLTSFGGRWLNRWTLVLPTILLGCYTVVMTALSGEKLQRGLGIYAALFSLLSYEYLNIFLGFSIDMPVAAAAVTTVFFLLKYDFDARALPIFALMLALSFAVRGPFGLILCGAVTAGCLIGSGRWKSLLWYALAGAAIAIICAALAMWAIHRQGGAELWKDVLEWQISSRMGRDRIFYYFTNAMGSFAITTIFAIATLIMKRREFLKMPLAMLLGWMLLPMVLLSIPGGKHLRYLTSVIPAFALCAAYGYANRDDSIVSKAMTAMMFVMDKCLNPVLLIATVAIAVVLPMLSRTMRIRCYFTHWSCAILLLGLIFVLLRKSRGDLKPLINTACLFTVFTAFVMNPLDAAIDGAELFTRQVEEQRIGRLYFYRLGPDHDDLKYIMNMRPEKRGMVVYLSRRDSDSRRLFNRMYPERNIASVLPDIRDDDVIVLLEKRLPELKAQVAPADRTVEILSPPGSRLGHRNAVAVRLRNAAAGK